MRILETKISLHLNNENLVMESDYSHECSICSICEIISGALCQVLGSQVQVSY